MKDLVIQRDYCFSIEGRERPLEREVALITGSSREIGAGTAIALAGEGVRIIGNHRDPSLGKAKRAEGVRMAIEQVGVQVDFVQADITVREDRERLGKALEAFGGKLDFLILNTSGNAQTARQVCVEANNALVDEFLPRMNEGGRIILMQSVPGHFDPQLRGLGKMPSFYDPIAQAKYEGEQSLRARIPKLQEKGVNLLLVCPPEVEDTSNMRLFRRLDKSISEKHAEISDMLGIPGSVTIDQVGQKVAELLKRKDLPSGYVELFSNVLDARSVLSEWYGDNAIFVDTLEIVDENRGIGRMIVAKEYTRGHFNDRVEMSLLPGHIMIEAAAQTLGLTALNGKIDGNSMPMFQGIGNVQFLKTVRPGEGLKIHTELTEQSRREFVGNVYITNMQDEKVAEINGLEAMVINRDVARRLLR
ncbi:MAG: SDR family NAD(P)-dependent oxidoreductase [Patescibacteria group bacterium]